MKLIVISAEENIQKEHEILHALFNEGLEYFHLRKPGTDKTSNERYLEKINSDFHSKIIIHQHHELAVTYQLKGIHYKSEVVKDTELISRTTQHYKTQSLCISAATHTFEDVRKCYSKVDYVLLSPVFNSISKDGYNSKFNKEELTQFLSENEIPEVVALGGIDENKIEECIEYGFKGIAVLGAIWKNCLFVETESIIDRFKKIQVKINNKVQV